MSLPGIGVVIAIGTALAGVLYLLYQQSNAQNQYTYDSYDRGGSYSDPVWQEPISAAITDGSQRRRKRNETCSICLDSSERNIKTLDCNHSFHQHCIDTWLMSHNTCPNCRKVI